MTDYVLRPVREAEFEPWARMIADTYGADRSETAIADQRAATDLDRTLGAFDGDVPVGGASIYRRTLTVPGARLPVAGVASVAVTPTHRRRGINTAMMRRQLHDLHEQGREPVAVLRPAEAAIYGRYGYGPATVGDRIRCERRELVFHRDVDFGDGTVHLVDRSTALPVITRVYDRTRATAVGWPDRDPCHWTVRLSREHAAAGTTSSRFALHREPGGEVTGYAMYRHRSGQEARTVVLEELVATTRQAHAALWRFVAGIDLATWIEHEIALDDPLRHLLVNPRAVESSAVDRLWVRLVDVDRALAARRYATAVDTVLDVEDAFCPWNTGRFRLCGDGATVSCERTGDAAELRLTTTELGAVFLGGTTLNSLAAAGRVEELKAGALTRVSAAFRHDREPFYPGGWAFPLY
ncbi:GNAT family N-acetyltransferase [Amycolatopsis suaedae]|uniref:GNAT family N-acetyltransferase n=1 Tax=Amycolatopsis suaedae TaxID=2510978 RepID=UPI001F0D378F|nr:GNAT family N-acetyltransferase [Amycolatopsis suaedae]